jgi:hypothetical protein
MGSCACPRVAWCIGGMLCRAAGRRGDKEAPTGHKGGSGSMRLGVGSACKRVCHAVGAHGHTQGLGAHAGHGVCTLGRRGGKRWRAVQWGPPADRGFGGTKRTPRMRAGGA